MVTSVLAVKIKTSTCSSFASQIGKNRREGCPLASEGKDTGIIPVSVSGTSGGGGSEARLETHSVGI